MTVVVGLAAKGTVWMATDTRVVGGGLVSEAQDPKIIRTPNFLIGCAGGSGYGQVLEMYLKEPQLEEDPYVNVAKHLRARIHNTLTQRGLKIADEDEILIGHKGRLFWMGGDDIYVMYPKLKYCAIGEGNEVAMGAMHATENSKKAPPWRLEKAINAACFFKPNCGLPMRMEILK